MSYALLKAAAYEEAPGRPGVVNAIAQVFFGLELALPLAVGFVAAHYGLVLALASLSLQPLGAVPNSG